MKKRVFHFKNFTSICIYWLFEILRKIFGEGPNHSFTSSDLDTSMSFPLLSFLKHPKHFITGSPGVLGNRE